MGDTITEVTEAAPVPETVEDADETTPDAPAVSTPIELELPDEQLLSLSVKERRIGVRIVPYDVVATHPVYGPLMFKQGAFGTVVPADVRLRMDHQDPPTGLGSKFWEQTDGAYMEFTVSRTSRGDDQLTLAVDGVSRGASVGFGELVGRAKTQRIDGQNVRVYGPDSARLGELSTTWKPTFSEAGVIYALSNEQGKEQAPMGESTEITPAGAPIDYDRLTAAIVAAGATSDRDTKIDTMLSKFEEMVELQRSQFKLPGVAERAKPKLEDWVNVALRRLAGDSSVNPALLKELALDDVVTTEQPGLVPNQLVPDYDDLISQNRPFLESTRQVRPPATGTSLILPILTSRAVAGTQAGNAEKGAITTTAPKVGTGTFAYKPVFGGADISIQMILRSDRSFMDLLTGELGEAYALDCEAKAIAALLAGYTDSASTSHAPDSGGTLDPEDPHFGDAWQTSILASKRAPDHIWMSALAVGAFIDAKDPATNSPLYSNLAASFTAGGGPGGRLSGLIPVYVPALDDAAVDVIVGPSRGFVWAEDPALRLEADVPSIAGRDIGLVGGLFPAPRYADAFTTYTIAS